MNTPLDMTGWKMWEHGVPDSIVTVKSIDNIGDNGANWNCVCGCGKSFIANGRYLRRGGIRSCGCIGNRNVIDMTGWVMKEHGVPDSRLTVLRRANVKLSGRIAWECLCECGRKFITIGKDIKSGHTLSCGCYCRDKNSSIRTHGDSNTRLYHIYNGMKARCYNSNDKRYIDYGFRGIFVCDEWRNSYKTFKAWAIQSGYSDNLTIDRIDVNGDYEPTNCRWANSIEQANNTRRNHLLEYGGETKTMAEWAKIKNMPYSTPKNAYKSV